MQQPGDQTWNGVPGTTGSPLATALQGDHGISEKEGPEATVSLSFRNLHP